jgi:aspartate/methionine/tyrosine aminotransferase
MEFAKLHSRARFNLATSGVMSYPLSDLPVKIEDLEINGPTMYGYGPLIERLARKNGVEQDCVVYLNGGTSLANNIAIAATTEPGDEVLTEAPGYELIDTTAALLGVEVRHFQRRFENGYRIDVDEIARLLTPRTRLIVVTNLHNPSSALTDDGTLRRLGEVARQAGARVLVDEVYLDIAFERTPASSFHLDRKTFVVTNSLTKAYGLSGLRCGWVLAEPELAHRMWRIHDLYGGTPTHAAELLAVVALDNLPRIAARSERIVKTNRAAFDQILGSRPQLAVVRTDAGSTSFPRLLRGTVERLHALLRQKYETSVVPGMFFGEAQHFRVGMGGDPEMTREGMLRLAQALEELG